MIYQNNLRTFKSSNNFRESVMNYKENYKKKNTKNKWNRKKYN